ncbi:MAG: hypothetical protein AAFY38_01380 [Pseudomonadota bacterium]
MKPLPQARADIAPSPRLTKSAALMGALLIAVPTGLLIHAVSLLF